MFHPFHIVVNHPVVEAEKFKKISEKFVPVRNLAGQRLARCCENEAAILFVFEETLGIKPLDHVSDAGLRNFQRSRDIDHAGVALGINQFENAFKVILDRSGAA